MTSSLDSVAVPIYMVVDTSGSMAPLMGILNDLLRSLLTDPKDGILADPAAVDVLHLGVVTFSSTASIAAPLTPVGELNAPYLKASGLTDYTAALKLLLKVLQSDLKKLKTEGFRVYRPAVFFLSDGRPADAFNSWLTALEDVKNLSFKGGPRIFSVGIGDADPEVVKEVSSANGAALMARTGTSPDEALRDYFQLVRDYGRSFRNSVKRKEGAAGLRWPTSLIELPTIGT